MRSFGPRLQSDAYIDKQNNHTKQQIYSKSKLFIEQSSLGEDTFDPDLLERFTIFSSRVFLNSIAEFKLSLLSSGTSRF
jgi:hypothetical protein